MENLNAASGTAILVTLMLPLIVAAADRRGRKTATDAPRREAFLTNHGRNGYVATFAGAFAGNIGIGSFLALFLFSRESPVIGFSVAAAYAIGLVLCAVFSPAMRRAALANQTVGLVDLLRKSHDAPRLMPIWLPITFVFVLRSAVQLGAIGLLAAGLFGGSSVFAVMFCGALITLYLVFGGYSAAVRTDMVQTAIILAGAVICAFGLGGQAGTPAPFWDLGHYGPALLVGIWLFIPFSALLAVDNWQRITLARSLKVSRRSYLAAAVLCGALYALIAVTGYRAEGGATMIESFSALVPEGWRWIILAMLIASIMSSIDSFIMPLVSAVGGNRPVADLRKFTVALMSTTIVVSITFADTLDTVIAAFNSLTVLLPSAMGALYLRRPARLAPALSINAGLVTALGVSLMDRNVAAIAGFFVSLLVYLAVTLWARRKKPPTHPSG